MPNSDQTYEYTEDFIAALQWIWGDGYLSPGGPQEVAVLLDGVDLTGRNVLDIGSGLGAIDVLLVQEHGANNVIGIDIEPPLIEHARQRAAKAGVAEKVQYQLVEHGPLPFENESFDVVFSKDAIIQISDKLALYRDVLRILRAGGVFVGSDWLRSGEGEHSDQFKEWLIAVQLTFDMKNLEQTRSALEQAGFVNVELKDRNEWYRQEIKNELATLSGRNYAELAKRIGHEKAAHRLRSSTLKQKVVERGELRPTHFIARKV